MKKTTNFNLPTYEANDMPNLLDGYNNAMNIIDTKLQTATDDAVDALADANNALAMAQSNATNINKEVSRATAAEDAIEQNISDTADKIAANFNNYKSNPIYYGADPTGVKDSTDAINECIKNNAGGCVQFTAGTYLISNSIYTYYGEKKHTNIDFGGSTIKCTGSGYNVFKIGYLETTEEQSYEFHTYISNGIIYGSTNANSSDYLFDIYDNFDGVHIVNTSVVLYGSSFINVGLFTHIDNCFIWNRGSSINTTAVYAHNPDVVITGTTFFNFQTFVDGSSIYSYNSRYLANDENSHNNCIVFKLSRSGVGVTSVGDYFDTVKNVVTATYDSQPIQICDCTTYSYTTINNPSFIDVSQISTFEILINGCVIDSNNTTNYQTLVMSSSITNQHVFSRSKISGNIYKGDSFTKTGLGIISNTGDNVYSPKTNQYNVLGYVLACEYAPINFCIYSGFDTYFVCAVITDKNGHVGGNVKQLIGEHPATIGFKTVANYGTFWLVEVSFNPETTQDNVYMSNIHTLRSLSNIIKTQNNAIEPNLTTPTSTLQAI